MARHDTHQSGLGFVLLKVLVRNLSRASSCYASYVLQLLVTLGSTRILEPGPHPGCGDRYLVQGTLYPDVIESCPPPGSGQKHSHTIKSHHNVGGLPKDLKFTLIEPLRELFKVRWRHVCFYCARQMCSYAAIADTTGLRTVDSL